MEADMNLTSDASCVPDADSYSALKVASFVLTLIIGVFGLLSNSLVVLVNRKLKKFSSTDVYLTALAISDNIQILCLSCYAYRYVYSIIFWYVQDWTSGGTVTLIGLLFMKISHFTNTYIIVVLGLDRYIQVKHVSKAKTWCTSRRALQCLAVIFVSALIFCAPRFVEFTALLIHRETSVKCYGYFSFSHGISRDEVYRLSYGFIIYVVVAYVIPLCLLIFTSFILIQIIYNRSKWLSKIHSMSKAQANASRVRKLEVNAILTLLVVTVSFVLLQTPDLSLVFIWRLSPSHGPTASIFSYQIFILNSSINFIIYSISSPSFRKRLKKMFKCAGSKEHSYGEETMLGAGNHTRSPTQPKMNVATIFPVDVPQREDNPKVNGIPNGVAHVETQNEENSLSSIKCD